MRSRDKLKNIQKANILAEQRYLQSKGLINETDNELSLLKEEICKLHGNNINEGLFDKAKDFFLKTFQKGEYRYKAIDLLLKSIDRNELHNEIDLDKKFKENFDLYTVNNQKLNDILYPHLGRTERLKKLNDGQFKIVMSRIKEVIYMIEIDSKYLKQRDTEKDERKKQEDERKKQEEDRKKQAEERRNKQNKLNELWATIFDTIYNSNTITPFQFLFRTDEGKGSGKHDSTLDTTEDTLKRIYKLSNKNVNQEIDTSSIINELNLLNQNFENYVNLYTEVYDDTKSLQEKIKEKEEHNNYANQVLENIKKYKTYKEMVLDVLTKKKRLVYHKGKIVYNGSTRRDLEKDKFNNTINTEKRTGYGLYTSPQLTTACRYAFAHIFGDLQKRGVPIKPNLDGKASIYRIELGDMPFLLRFDPNIDKEELEMLLAFGIGGYDGLYKARSGNEVEISVITSDNISKAERITERNYPKEFKEITEYGLKYIKSSEYNHSSPTGFVQNQKFITARLSEILKNL